MRIIAHLDMDYFFAQIEERENPAFKDQPVVVGADPKGGKGRGVVSTANYLARRFGIKSGMPISWAFRACPQAVYLRPRHDFYQEVSANIRKIIEKVLARDTIAEFTLEQSEGLQHDRLGGKIEQVSIDEFYLDLSGLKNWEKSQKFCQYLKDKILENEKLSCSIGLGPNKLIAKIASGFKKPAGFTVVKEKEAGKFLSPLPVDVLPGVGPKTSQALSGQGVKTVADLRKIPQERLISLFGKWGQNLWTESQGIDESEVEETWERKTLGVQTTFARDTQNFYFLHRTLFDLCQKVWEDCQSEKLSPQMIEVTMRYFDFETHTHQKTLPKPLTSLYQFRQEAENLLKNLLKPKPVRLLGVRVGKWA